MITSVWFGSIVLHTERSDSNALWYRCTFFYTQHRSNTPYRLRTQCLYAAPLLHTAPFRRTATVRHTFSLDRYCTPPLSAVPLLCTKPLRRTTTVRHTSTPYLSAQCRFRDGRITTVFLRYFYGISAVLLRYYYGITRVLGKYVMHQSILDTPMLQGIFTDRNAPFDTPTPAP